MKEFRDYDSLVAGSSFLDEKVDNYEDWLEFLSRIKNGSNEEKLCPNRQYFLIRENDNKIIGLINIRYDLNEWMLKYGGNIGYSIRPTERRKGYNKINLFLAIEKCQEMGLKKVLLITDNDNVASIKTIESLGGVLNNKIKNEEGSGLISRYYINVDESLSSNKGLVK